MKKLMAALVALMLVALPALGESEWYSGIANEITENMIALARDEGYTAMYTSTPNEAVEAFAAAKLNEPVAVWRIDLPDDERMKQILEEEAGGSLSDPVYESMRAMISGMLFSVVNNQQGATAMVASTLLSRTQTERMPENFTEQIWLLGYEDALVGVSFIQTGEDSVSVYASPLFGWTSADAEKLPDALAPFAETLIPAEIGEAAEREAKFIEGDLREEIAREMAGRVILLAGDEEWLGAMGYTAERKFLPDLASAGELTNEWHYHMATKAGTKLLLGAVSEIKLSDEALEAMIQQIAISGCSTVNAQVGQYALTEASMVRVTRSMRIPEDFKDSLIILEYGKALIGVSFVQTGADTATVTATPIFSDGTKDAETLAGEVAQASLIAQVEE